MPIESTELTCANARVLPRNASISNSGKAARMARLRVSARIGHLTHGHRPALFARELLGNEIADTQTPRVDAERRVYPAGAGQNASVYDVEPAHAVDAPLRINDGV